jgi:hypothetical protein
MKVKAVVLDGQLINIGEWGAGFSEDEGSPPPPLPDGAVEGEFDVGITADGKYVLQNDYAELRKAAYPPIGDQLDALWKGGDALEEMKQVVMSVKQQYPKLTE